MRRYGVVLEVFVAFVGLLALVAMGGGWVTAVALLCIASGIGVVLSRRH
jgi:hypothetical protein